MTFSLNFLQSALGKQNDPPYTQTAVKDSVLWELRGICVFFSEKVLF